MIINYIQSYLYLGNAKHIKLASHGPRPISLTGVIQYFSSSYERKTSVIEGSMELHVSLRFIVGE